MNWKHFLRAFISAAIISFPYNIIGCAGEYYDPYDYFVSFFHNKTAGETGYPQFHYTSHQFLYDGNETMDAAAVTSAEWRGYCGNAFDEKAAYQFVCKYAWKDLNSLYFHLEKKQPLKIPDSVKRNGFTQYLMKTPDLEALGYIMYAKQTEPQVTGSWMEWEPVERDKPKMDKLIKNGQQLYKAAKKDFIKLRYAYQLVRLAHYSGRYNDCKNWYDEMITPNTTASAVKDLALGLKAGAMMRLGQKSKAAAIFSQLFSKSALKRVSNYMSFDWCVQRFNQDSRSACLRECANNTDKANMLGLFLLGEHTPTSVKAIEQVYGFSPNGALLEMLVTREVHKMEEYYFSKDIDKHRPKSFDIYYNYDDGGGVDYYAEAAKQGPALIGLCQQIAGNAATKNKGLYQVAAAHTALILKDYDQCRRLLDACKAGVSGLIKDQWEMTSLLHAINSRNTVDAGLENTVAAALPWLEQKAQADADYARFIRRLFADVMAIRYAKQNNMHKYALSMGVADALQQRYNKNEWGFWSRSLGVLRSKLEGPQVEALVKLMEQPGNSLEKYMVRTSKFTKDDVNDVAGTAFMRQLNWDKALDWYKKIPAAYYNSETYKTWLAANPFAGLMLDVHTKTKWDTRRYTKPEFAQKMKELQAAQAKGGDAAAQAHYDYATGLYNMSYYGNSWMMVEYGWSSYAPVIDSPAKMNSFEKWYYTANNAEAHYKKAAELSGNKELKARSLYMAAKCAQKNMPGLPNSYADNYRQEMRNWLTGFAKEYDYFPRLKKEYGQTAFYKEAMSTCSYFRDFVSGKP